jgi:hypothetical protein
MPCYCTRDAIEISGPSATGRKLVAGLIERCVAGGASIDARRGHVLVVFAAERGFGALFTDDAELF